MDKVITLAVATRNDFVGLWFTINSALLSVRGTELEGKLDFSVVNNSEDPQARAHITEYCARYRIPCVEHTTVYSNSVARNMAVKNSTTGYTVLADSHVLFSAGFFSEYHHILESCNNVGLIHSPFTSNGGAPNWLSTCFYNLQKFATNLHGSFSRRGALPDKMYPVALSPHAAYGFRTRQWLDYGGYMNECMGNGGGEPFVTYKYWMFGSAAYLTPKVGFIHLDSKPYRRSRRLWLRNHALVAAALAGYDIGYRYAASLHCKPIFDRAIWSIAEPYHEQIKLKSVVRFENLLAHFKQVQARPFV